MRLYITDRESNLVLKCNNIDELLHFIDNKTSEGVVRIMSQIKGKDFDWGSDGKLNYKLLHKEFLTKLKKNIIDFFKIIVLKDDEINFYYVQAQTLYDKIVERRLIKEKRDGLFTIPESIDIYRKVFDSILREEYDIIENLNKENK